MRTTCKNPSPLLASHPSRRRRKAGVVDPLRVCGEQASPARLQQLCEDEERLWELHFELPLLPERRGAARVRAFQRPRLGNAGVPRSAVRIRTVQTRFSQAKCHLAVRK
ncbi:unnamed protein product [Amoebophrya sp. A120]|nr:unnamed protein product [Amoebophrya sp. A120]|eukprot:GSA120T00018292001.1